MTASSQGGQQKPAPAVVAPPPPAAPSAPTLGKQILGIWRNEKATWYFNDDGTARIEIQTLNDQGTATTYINWRVNESAGSITYTITRATLVGSNGYDYDRELSKTYTQSIRMDGGELIINIERLHR